MRRVLNVAEKPSVAKAMSAALSNSNAKTLPSQSQYNPIYSFEGLFLSEPATITITSVTGHILEIEFPSEYQNWSSVNPLALLNEAQVLVKDSGDKIPVIKNLETLARSSTDLFLWLDCDREGEAIAYEVINVCHRTNQSLRIHRAKFSSVTKQDLVRAFLNPGRPNPSLNEAVLVRQEIDLRSGACFTRYQTLLIRKHFPKALTESIASYGPCQFPTLYFVVERYLNHIAFTNVKYWTLHLELEKSNISFDLLWNRQRLFDKFTAGLIYEIEMENPVARVTDMGRKNQKRFKPYPLTTVDLQKLAVSKLKMSSDTAMKVAEKLYTKGYISYPRTETNLYPPTFDFKKIITSLKGDKAYREHAEGLLTENKFSKPRNGKKDDKAHPPIHPVKVYDGDPKSNEYRLFDLISRHFLANCSEDANTEVITIKVKVNKEFFHTSGVQIIEKNFLEIYEKFYVLQEKRLPPLDQGEIVPIKSFVLKEGQTTPPKLLSEQDLIGLMDKHGIGTDATIHEHIKTIQDRKYAVKVSNVFKPTQLGIAILGAYQRINLSLAKPENRADTEKTLGLVAEGQKTRSEVLRKFLSDLENAFTYLNDHLNIFMRHFKEIFEQFYCLSNIQLEGAPADFEEAAPQQALDMKPPVLVKLDHCECRQGTLTVRLSKKNAYFVGCSQFPKCTTTFFFRTKFKLIEPSGNACQACGSPLVRVAYELELEGVNHFLCVKRECLRSIFEFLNKPQTPLPNPQNNPVQARTLTRSPGAARGGRGNQFPSSQENSRNQRFNGGGDTYTCFKCNKKGHFANKCPGINEENVIRERTASKRKPKRGRKPEFL